MVTITAFLMHDYRKVYFFADVQMFVIAENLGTFLLEIGKYYGILSLGITYRHGCASKKTAIKRYTFL
jgi:hypothetical protein